MFPANSPLQLLDNPFPEPVHIRLFLKRDDLLHPLVSGNKWRKLKYNLLAAQEQGLDTLLTFGGAYSIICMQRLRLVRYLASEPSASCGEKNLPENH